MGQSEPGIWRIIHTREPVHVRGGRTTRGSDRTTSSGERTTPAPATTIVAVALEVDL